MNQQPPPAGVCGTPTTARARSASHERLYCAETESHFNARLEAHHQLTLLQEQENTKLRVMKYGSAGRSSVGKSSPAHALASPVRRSIQRQSLAGSPHSPRFYPSTQLLPRADVNCGDNDGVVAGKATRALTVTEDKSIGGREGGNDTGHTAVMVALQQPSPPLPIASAPALHHFPPPLPEGGFMGYREQRRAALAAKSRSRPVSAAGSTVRSKSPARYRTPASANERETTHGASIGKQARAAVATPVSAVPRSRPASTARSVSRSGAEVVTHAVVSCVASARPIARSHLKSARSVPSAVASPALSSPRGGDGRTFDNTPAASEEDDGRPSVRGPAEAVENGWLNSQSRNPSPMPWRPPGAVSCDATPTEDAEDPPLGCAPADGVRNRPLRSQCKTNPAVGGARAANRLRPSGPQIRSNTGVRAVSKGALVRAPSSRPPSVPRRAASASAVGMSFGKPDSRAWSRVAASRSPSAVDATSARGGVVPSVAAPRRHATTTVVTATAARTAATTLRHRSPSLTLQRAAGAVEQQQQQQQQHATATADASPFKRPSICAPTASSRSYAAIGKTQRAAAMARGGGSDGEGSRDDSQRRRRRLESPVGDDPRAALTNRSALPRMLPSASFPHRTPGRSATAATSRSCSPAPASATAVPTAASLVRLPSGSRSGLPQQRQEWSAVPRAAPPLPLGGMLSTVVSCVPSPRVSTPSFVDASASLTIPPIRADQNVSAESPVQRSFSRDRWDQSGVGLHGGVSAEVATEEVESGTPRPRLEVVQQQQQQQSTHSPLIRDSPDAAPQPQHQPERLSRREVNDTKVATTFEPSPSVHSPPSVPCDENKDNNSDTRADDTTRVDPDSGTVVDEDNGFLQSPEQQSFEVRPKEAVEPVVATDAQQMVSVILEEAPLEEAPHHRRSRRSGSPGTPVRGTANADVFGRNSATRRSSTRASLVMQELDNGSAGQTPGPRRLSGGSRRWSGGGAVVLRCSTDGLDVSLSPASDDTRIGAPQGRNSMRDSDTVFGRRSSRRSARNTGRISGVILEPMPEAATPLAEPHPQEAVPRPRHLDPRAPAAIDPRHSPDTTKPERENGPDNITTTEGKHRWGVPQAETLRCSKADNDVMILGSSSDDADERPSVARLFSPCGRVSVLLHGEQQGGIAAAGAPGHGEDTDRTFADGVTSGPRPSANTPATGDGNSPEVTTAIRAPPSRIFELTPVGYPLGLGSHVGGATVERSSPRKNAPVSDGDNNVNIFARADPVALVHHRLSMGGIVDFTSDDHPSDYDASWLSLPQQPHRAKPQIAAGSSIAAVQSGVNYNTRDSDSRGGSSADRSSGVFGPPHWAVDAVSHVAVSDAATSPMEAATHARSGKRKAKRPRTVAASAASNTRRATSARTEGNGSVARDRNHEEEEEEADGEAGDDPDDTLYTRLRQRERLPVDYKVWERVLIAETTPRRATPKRGASKTPGRSTTQRGGSRQELQH